MNIKELHTTEKPVSAIAIFKSDLGNATAIQILKGEKLKEHITTVPAMLICVSGKAVFENENEVTATLETGDYIEIEQMVKHWLEGITLSQLILIK